jgi:hypothetical protein
MMDTAVVRWNDGTYDVSRECVMCGSASCPNPVHHERYKVYGEDKWQVALVEEELEITGLKQQLPRNVNWGERKDALDRLIENEDFAPEEQEDANY